MVQRLSAQHTVLAHRTKQTWLEQPLIKQLSSFLFPKRKQGDTKLSCSTTEDSASLKAEAHTLYASGIFLSSKGKQEELPSPDSI